MGLEWTTIIAALFAATPPTIAAVLAYRKVQKVHVEINSRMTEMLKLAKRDSHAAGVKAERTRDRGHEC